MFKDSGSVFTIFIHCKDYKIIKRILKSISNQKKYIIKQYLFKLNKVFKILFKYLQKNVLKYFTIMPTINNTHFEIRRTIAVPSHITPVDKL